METHENYTLGSIPATPDSPHNVAIRGTVRPAARTKWKPPSDAANVAGYRVYWRATDSPTWDDSPWVGSATAYRFDGLVIDNYFFGAVSVGHDSNERVVVFQSSHR